MSYVIRHDQYGYWFNEVDAKDEGLSEVDLYAYTRDGELYFGGGFRNLPKAERRIPKGATRFATREEAESAEDWGRYCSERHVVKVKEKVK